MTGRLARPKSSPAATRAARYSPRMSLRLPSRVLAVAALSVVLHACSSSTTLLESDVPLPDGMTVVRSADLRRDAGTLTGGRFLLAGRVRDAGELLSDTLGRFESGGWTVVDSRAGLDLATARLEKGARRAELSIHRRTLEPDMSTGMLEVTSGATPTGG